MAGATVITTRADFHRLASPDTRVPIEVHVPITDPFTAYRRARQPTDGFFLETTGGQPGWGYFGVTPTDRIQVTADTTSLTDTQSPSLDALTTRIEQETLVRGTCTVPYPCGLVGWISYDVARELETIPDTTTNDCTLPRLQAAFYDTIAAWKTPTTDGPVTLRITSCPLITTDPDDAFDAGRDAALTLAHSVTTNSRTPMNNQSPGPVTFTSDCGREAYLDRVRRIKHEITDGNTFQTNISHRLTAPATIHPVILYDALRTVNPAPYSALLEFPDVDLVSASPELLLERTDDTIITEPIAGTRPRGDTTQEDVALEHDLCTDEKERAEHAMLVDLERNDLGKVCTPGSVTVSEYRRVDRYAEVMHLVSRIEGTLTPDISLTDVIAAVFPGGTITGVPKPKTMELIDTVETTRRGPYTGSIGIFGLDDRATLNIAIRTFVRTNDEYHLRVGGGIVHDSIPDREYQETLDKARGLLNAVTTVLDTDLLNEPPRS